MCVCVCVCVCVLIPALQDVFCRQWNPLVNPLDVTGRLISAVSLFRGLESAQVIIVLGQEEVSIEVSFFQSRGYTGIPSVSLPRLVSPCSQPI